VRDRRALRDLRALAADPVGALALGSAGALCLVVAGVGAVAVVAELVGTWNYYLVMERAVALAAPVATALLGVAVLAGAGAVVRAS